MQSKTFWPTWALLLGLSGTSDFDWRNYQSQQWLPWTWALLTRLALVWLLEKCTRSLPKRWCYKQDERLKKTLDPLELSASQSRKAALAPPHCSFIVTDPNSSIDSLWTGWGLQHRAVDIFMACKKGMVQEVVHLLDSGTFRVANWHCKNQRCGLSMFKQWVFIHSSMTVFVKFVPF